MSQILHSAEHVLFVYILFYYDLLNDAASIASYKTSKNKIVLNSKWERILTEAVVLSFVVLLQHFRAGSGKPRKTQDKVAGVPAEFLNGQLSNTSQECYCLGQLALTFMFS
jgi:hypothetical protein